MASSMYDFKGTNISGDAVDLSKYKGHVCIVVNVASKWGATDREYKQLQQLHDQFSGREGDGLRILAFPCNQFGKQEPGSSEEIIAFAAGYNFKGDIFEKCDVNGKNAHPLWEWMKSQKNGRGTLGDNIKWNFTKFLIDQNGQVVCREATTTHSITLEPKIQKLYDNK
jgi:phospholipid-hydroperoxide glutathione peroxidase